MQTRRKINENVNGWRWVTVKCRVHKKQSTREKSRKEKQKVFPPRYLITSYYMNGLKSGSNRDYKTHGSDSNLASQELSHGSQSPETTWEKLKWCAQQMPAYLSRKGNLISDFWSSRRSEKPPFTGHSHISCHTLKRENIFPRFYPVRVIMPCH